MCTFISRLVTLCLLLASQAVASAQSPLRNGSFEASTLEGWSTHVYGATPEISMDDNRPHAGHHSLRMRSTEPTDTAFGQEILLKPNAFYRLTGWVRTRALNPMGAPVYGTFQIQLPGGQGVLASGKSHGGDSDWTSVTIPFRSPTDGRTRIAIFFVGYGKGTGEAWFDDLRLEEMRVDSSPIRVAREPLCPGEISPLQYGQFVEYLCNLIPSMWSEKLYDGSFEGLSPYKFVYIRELDFREKPWYPSGAANRAEYTLDSSTKVSGEASQRVRVEGGPPCTVGISQDGIAVQKGLACRFGVYLKQAGVKAPITVRIHREGRTIAERYIGPVSGEWAKQAVELTPLETTPDATFSISFRGPGTLWLDSASLMPADNVGGWRKDVVEAVRALKPGVIRFGGSALDEPSLGDFRWSDTLGDPDRRKPFRAWGGLQPAGAGLEEIVRFCYAVGAEPLICVRFTRSNPEEAAKEVEYFNGSPDTPMGSLRARNGHRQPYRIRFWQIGNEVGGEQYAARVADFARAMKKTDPSIRLLSSYPSEEVVRNAGDLLDYLCPHHYGCADLGAMASDFERLRKLIAGSGTGRKMRVAVTEWNTTAGDWGTRRAMLWTLENALACSRYHNLMHRNADLVEIANRSNLINSFCSGIIQTDNHRLYRTPTYYAQQLYAKLAGNRPLKIESALPADMAPDVSATLSHDGSELVLFAVNESTEAVTRQIDLSEFGPHGLRAEVWTLSDTKQAGEPDVTNNFGEPERVVPVRSTFLAPSNRFSYRFPPLSLTVLRWRIGAP